MYGLQEDGDGGMLCTEHPFKNNTPAGGICAFCLQEKLGKLVSSSFPIAVFPSTASSSPSFRSDTTTATTTGAAVGPPARMVNNVNSSSLLCSSSNTQINQINPSNNTTNDCRYHHHSNRSRMLYLLGQKKSKNKNLVVDGVHA